MLPTTVVCNEGIPGAVLTFTHFLNSSRDTTISTHIQRLHSAQNTALFWMFRKFTKYTSQTLSNKVLTVFLYLLFCIFRFGNKNRTVNEKQTRTKCIIYFFGPDQMKPRESNYKHKHTRNLIKCNFRLCKDQQGH